MNDIIVHRIAIAKAVILALVTLLGLGISLAHAQDVRHDGSACHCGDGNSGVHTGN